jgi:hypothetical protein
MLSDEDIASIALMRQMLAQTDAALQLLGHTVPVSTAPPVISGAPHVGQTLTVTAGTWK